MKAIYQKLKRTSIQLSERIEVRCSFYDERSKYWKEKEKQGIRYLAQTKALEEAVRNLNDTMESIDTYLKL